MKKKLVVLLMSVSVSVSVMAGGGMVHIPENDGPAGVPDSGGTLCLTVLGLTLLWRVKRVI